MRGLRKSKKLSWAPDVNLCQVRLFLSEESPSQVGSGAQDHLQAKASWLPHSTGTASDDILPPGFEGGHPTNQSQIKLSEIPVIKWKCPPRVVLNLTWEVVAGEESAEVEVQNEREMRVLEAVYPRPSAIPTNPTFPADVEDSKHNDHQILLIPITPIEDEDGTDATSDSVGPFNVPMSSQLAPGIPPAQNGIPNIPVNENPVAGVLPGIEPDVVAAASAAFSALNKNNEQGSLIDPDLLVKILGNPKLIEKLITDYGATQIVPKPAASIIPPSDPPPPVISSDQSLLHMNGTEFTTPSSLTATSSGPCYVQPNGVGAGFLPNSRFPSPGGPASAAPTRAPQTKDLNYYKNLIQQHGGERKQTPQQFGGHYGQQLGTSQEIVNPRSRDAKPKTMKPCIYFNSSRGCRHGANCAYQHDASSQQRGSGAPEVQSAKRMKTDGEISG